MKSLSFIILFLVFNSILYAQHAVDYGILKQPDEEVIYSFKLKSSHKIALICSQKDGKYIVYRFGTIDKIELQYPSTLNATSWKLFRYSGYSRTGDHNAALDEYSLSFTNNNITYKIYDEWDGEEKSYAASILITTDDKKTELAGDAGSRKGTLKSLGNKGTLMHNYYQDDNK